MKRIPMASVLVPIVSILIALAASVAWAQHHGGSGSLSAEEQAQLLELLERSRAETEAIIADATGDAWSEKPAEGAWSAGEVLEHVAMAEAGLRALAQMALAGDEDPAWAESDSGIEGILGMMSDRSQKFQAPDTFQPKGAMSREEVLAMYASERAKTIDLFRTAAGGAVKKHTYQGPPGKLNVQQWLGMIGAHNLRHNEQMKEAVAAAGM